MTLRVVFDESSVDFVELALKEGDFVERIEAHLDELADVLMTMRARGMAVAVSPLGFGTECWPGVPFDSFLGDGRLPVESGIREVDRDARVRCNNLLDRCPNWDLGGVTDLEVTIDNRRLLAPSIAYAHARELRSSRVACLVFGGCVRRGEALVSVAGVTASIRFLADADDVPGFLRTVFSAENVPEGEFFVLATDAFPMLVFAEKLNFSSFKGTYRHVRDDVVTALAAINDHFSLLLEEHAGQPDLVERGLGRLGCNASRESQNTRSSSRLMGKRDVHYQGQKVRCEWHAKLAPQHNRIHFALLDDGRVLIGKFVDHFPT
ncbi:MAG: hypothetical protein ACRDYA_06175 [Egibacteraceae bacterium]